MVFLTSNTTTILIVADNARSHWTTVTSCHESTSSVSLDDDEEEHDKWQAEAIFSAPPRAPIRQESSEHRYLTQSVNRGYVDRSYSVKNWVNLDSEETETDYYYDDDDDEQRS